MKGWYSASGEAGCYCSVTASGAMKEFSPFVLFVLCNSKRQTPKTKKKHRQRHDKDDSGGTVRLYSFSFCPYLCTAFICFPSLFLSLSSVLVPAKSPGAAGCWWRPSRSSLLRMLLFHNGKDTSASHSARKSPCPAWHTYPKIRRSNGCCQASHFPTRIVQFHHRRTVTKQRACCSRTRT